MQLLIVESPAKAKTINKYLGSDYKVMASYGHIRDLLSKDGSVQPEADFAMTWEMSARGKKFVTDVKKLLKNTLKLLVVLYLTKKLLPYVDVPEIVTTNTKRS